MSAVTMRRAAPPGSTIVKRSKNPCDYVDCFSVALPLEGAYSIDYLTAVTFLSIPSWAARLMRLRDVLMRPLGLKTGDGEWQSEVARDVQFAPGQRAIFFTVTERSEDELVMGERDRHLDFACSVRRVPSDSGGVEVSLTTAVWFNNFGGRCYFFFVKPFHRAIIRSLMRRMAARLCAASFAR